ncbi:MAG: thioredoxin fold domain-containing protein [Betaproteobacteria bacterium]|nr:thioredoxin fold domain-containing protein [Betaproteobacteria bacterium]
MTIFKWIPCLVIGLSLALAGCDRAPSSGAKSPAGSQESRVPLSALYDTVAAKANGFTIGNMMATRVAYVMFDPQCPHCAQLWRNAKPLLGQIRMVWAPVRFAGDISLRQGAVLLASKEPVPEMDAHERSLEAKRGGLVPPAEIPPELIAKVKANTELMAQIGADEVPFVVYKDPRTGQPASFKGAMGTEDLRKLLGL